MQWEMIIIKSKLVVQLTVACLAKRMEGLLLQGIDIDLCWEERKPNSNYYLILAELLNVN